MRSRDVFEEVGRYEKPPLAPLPAVDDYAALELHGLLKVTPRSRRILDVALRAMGYPAFHRRLARDGEHLLRSTNMRADKLFGPAYSATVALADDVRTDSAIDRAASLVVAARELCDDVMTGRLPADEHRGRPLEMGQYPNLFATSVGLVDGRPCLVKSSRFDTIGVVVGRNVYTLRIGAPGAASARSIADALGAIAESSKRRPRDADHAPGLLSAADKKTLRAALVAMDEDPVNARSISALRGCFMVLCLDLEHRPKDAAEAGLLTQAGNPANRWYLASFQLVVFGNARATGLFSFPAYLDGNVMMRAAAEIQRRAGRLDLAATSPALPAADALSWSLDRALVRAARSDVEAIRDSQQATFEISLGRRHFPEAGVDPVSAFVIALALATKRSARTLPSILQLVTVSKYRCVPVGAAVVTTPQVRAVVDAMEKGLRIEASALRDAIASEHGACRVERERLSLRWSIEAFLRTRRGLARLRALGAFAAGLAALKSVGAAESERIIISHPEIFPELLLVGRPGIRLPYVSHYGLHYQMFDDHTVVTFMPGKNWPVANSDFARQIERALRQVVEAASGFRETGVRAT